MPTKPTKKPRAVPECRYREQYGVIVICKDENDQKKVYEKLLKQGFKPRVVAT
ncbi:hypothetical protein Dalk_3541 [Desulfatibacillum aliphaticivorans]|uniref:Uncharacterized protein n=1 Tax=Desulfatibacillum aliphaticivorans TaxID=218208 RepID=B8FC24_DESAL|nr:hypothetical protein [Desulfatibacillum aliphaticivorans]ACL05229.1 hypothetical protein Dalk_3541 [Desulfatibacillum aliphaticivorans]